MVHQRTSSATWAILAALLTSAAAQTALAKDPTQFSALDYEVRIDAVENLRSCVVTAWVPVALPQGSEMIKPIILIGKQVRDAAGKDILLPDKPFVDEKYMLRQQRLATWETKINAGMRIPIGGSGPCPAILKDVQGELAAEVADKFTTLKIPIEAGKEFELAPNVKGKILGIAPVEMYGRKGLKATYSYFIPGKPSDILPVQIAKFALYDAHDKPIIIDTRTGMKETPGKDGITVEGGLVVASDTGKPAPTQVEFTVATGITLQHLPAPVGDVDLHGIKDLPMAKGPVQLPERVAWLAEAKTTDGYQVGISAAHIQIRRVNFDGGMTMDSRSSEFMLAVRPPEGIPSSKLVTVTFDAITGPDGKNLLIPNQSLGDARNIHSQPWQPFAQSPPIALPNDSLHPSLAQVKGTAVIVAPATVKHQDLPLRAGATAELVPGVSITLGKPPIPAADGSFTIPYNFDLALASSEADLPCFPRGLVMAEWLDDAGRIYPVGWPNNRPAFVFGDESKPSPTGRHGNGYAHFSPPPGFTGNIVALRAYGGEAIAVKRIPFELNNVPLMSSPAMSPVE